jgi:hypothetical protein
VSRPIQYALPGGDDAHVAGRAAIYGLVLVAAGMAGRRCREGVVRSTLIRLGGALVAAEPVGHGVGLLIPVTWGVPVTTVSLVGGLPALVCWWWETVTGSGRAPGHRPVPDGTGWWRRDGEIIGVTRRRGSRSGQSVRAHM